jgi:hypothetical protein
MKGGGSPVARILRLRKELEPTAEDMLYAANRQKARILDRTGKGRDVEGKAFAPYSENGPYYYNPNGRLGKAQKQISDKSQKAAARRFLNKITTKGERAKSGAPAVSRTGRSIRFESYAAFKKWLGRATVDLRGPRSPHMLQSLIVVARSAVEAVIGIYGDTAARASANNEKRRFFGFSKSDARAIAQDLRTRITARLKFGGG